MNEPPPPGDPVWTYRGYQMRPAEFNTAMVHLYRGEVQRSNTWRLRLDNTTNWAVVSTGAAISFALSAPTNHYSVIILNTLLVTLFLWIEARRYRYYELWSRRVRLMETDFFAAMLVPPFAPNPEWAENLAESLLQPDFPISMWEAFGRRLRRNYVSIFFILAAALLLKIYLHPVQAASLEAMVHRAALGSIPGWSVLTAGLLYNGALFLIAYLTAGLHQASGEVLPKWDSSFPMFGALRRAMEVHDAETTDGQKPPVRQFGRRRKQVLAFIIASQPQAIADRILKELNRSLTALHGRGMYAHQEREVLMVAVTVTEMPRLKALVKAEDPNAFVIIAPAQEILGRGFQPLGF